MSNDLLAQGIAAVKAGNEQEARRLLGEAIRQNPNNENVWGWLYNVSNNDQERMDCLKQIVRINPKNEKANQLLNDSNKFQQLYKNLNANPPGREPDKQVQGQVDLYRPMKKCPYCAEMVFAEAKVCRYCGRDINPKVVSAPKTKAGRSENKQLLYWIIIWVVTLPCVIIAILAYFRK